MNRIFRKPVFQALRTLITIATGAGRRPEPVVPEHPNSPNPAGVEQGSSGFQPESHDLHDKHNAPTVTPNSTPIGKHSSFNRPRRGQIERCNQRNITSDLIRVISLWNQSTQAGCLSYLGGR